MRTWTADFNGFGRLRVLLRVGVPTGARVNPGEGWAMQLRGELDRRWHEMFAALAGGSDVPPSRRLRTEGLMEAAVLLELAAEEELLSAMDACYRDAFGRSIAEDFGNDWREFYPFPQIPAVGRRAPVFPSTPD